MQAQTGWAGGCGARRRMGAPGLGSGEQCLGGGPSMWGGEKRCGQSWLAERGGNTQGQTAFKMVRRAALQRLPQTSHQREDMTEERKKERG